MLTAKFGFPLSKALRQPGDKKGGVTGKKEQRHDIPQPKSLEYSVQRISCRFYKSGGILFFDRNPPYFFAVHIFDDELAILIDHVAVAVAFFRQCAGTGIDVEIISHLVHGLYMSMACLLYTSHSAGSLSCCVS